MKLVQINATANWGSTGKIAEQIGNAAIARGWESFIVYGRHSSNSNSHLIKIGNRFSTLVHYAFNRLFDREGLCSIIATRKLVAILKDIDPDIVHLHNIHDHWLNYKILFEYLNATDIKVVWTFHDFWAITGHCTHFIRMGCNKWKDKCAGCPVVKREKLPLIDRTEENFTLKRLLFNANRNLHIVAVSEWVGKSLTSSCLGDKDIRVILNGIDVNVFHPGKCINRPTWADNKFIIISVSSQWDKGDKGLNDYIAMSSILNEDEIIVLVGVTDSIKSSLPKNIIGICQTRDQRELASLYSMADVLTCLSSAETFGMTIIEGYACGVPAVVYDNTAPPALITPQTGFIAPDKDYRKVYDYIQIIKKNGKRVYSQPCVDLVKSKYTVEKNTENYLSLYNEII